MNPLDAMKHLAAAMKCRGCIFAAAVLSVAPVGPYAGPAAAQGLPLANVVAGEEHCVVNVPADDVLNLRTGPGTRYRVLSGLRYGACGIMLRGRCVGNWCPVEEGHYAGWVHARYIAMVSPARYCIVGIPPGGRLPLRAFPSFRSRVMTELGPRTCSIALLPYAREGWQKIRADGWEGWVPRAHLSGQ